MRVHRTDLVSFAFGLLFLALSAWWLLAQVLGLVLPPVGWFLAGGLILIGVLGLIGALRSSRHTGKPEPADPAGPDPTRPEASGASGTSASGTPWADTTGTEPLGPPSTDTDSLGIPWADTTGTEPPSGPWTDLSEGDRTIVDSGSGTDRPGRTGEPTGGLPADDDRTLDLPAGSETPPSEHRGPAA